MQLPREFIQLALTFDARVLLAEAEALGEQAWRPHPEGHRGNWALPLVALDGDPSNDGVKGRMRPTPALVRSPYFRQVLAALDVPIGRTRLMRIDGNSEAGEHVDVNYYWQQRVRVHVPIQTDPAVTFSCGAQRTHMREGECWIFDTWRLHNVTNPNPTRRIHLVADTVGSDAFRAFWHDGARRHVPYDSERNVLPPYEATNFPVVMSPAEMARLFAILDAELRGIEAAGELRAAYCAFAADWSALWQQHADAAAAWSRYAALLDRARARIAQCAASVQLSNRTDAAFAIDQFILTPALNTELAPRGARMARRRFDRPVFIVSSPRSGSSLLFETLAQSPDLYSIGGESHEIIEGVEALHPAAHGWSSNYLDAADSGDAVAALLAERFAALARDRDGQAPQAPAFRFLEKTPKNSLRVPFLRRVFPDALFVYLCRDERATMSSMLDAWRSGRFVTYPELPGWRGPPWSLLLVPGWQELAGAPLAQIVVHQWETATRMLLDDLEALPPSSWCVASYDGIIAAPAEEIQRLCRFLDIGWDRDLIVPLPNSRHTLTAPAADKWHKNSAEIEPWLGATAATAERARALFARAPLRRGPARSDPAPAVSALSSAHTDNVPEILSRLRATLIVSMRGAGRIVLLRADGGGLNAHVRAFPHACAIATAPGRLAIGVRAAVWDYRDVPAAAARLHPARHDACFVPRNLHVTGDIALHEMAFGADETLWLVNTRFSTLCTFASDTSFEARWRPRFISGLGAEDRCHLNGVALHDGTPYCVSALGASDSPAGWRERRHDSGVLVDVASGEISVAGLRMPHSPRLHDGALWLLEGADGALVRVDPARGTRETVAVLPGFTRGLALAGDYAFVGISCVRDRELDLPLAQRLAQAPPQCGVWIVDLRDGSIAGFVRLEGEAREVFDVQLLPGVVYPDLLELDDDLVGASFVVADAALEDFR